MSKIFSIISVIQEQRILFSSMRAFETDKNKKGYIKVITHLDIDS